MGKLEALEILGLEKNANFEEIQEAYKALIENMHPEDNAEDFSNIQRAYHFLRSLEYQNKNIQNKTINHSFRHDAIEYVEDNNEIVKDNLDELEDYFNEIDEESNHYLDEHNKINYEKDTLRAYVLGYLETKDFEPDYLLYLLETYPLLPKHYKQLAFRIKNIINEDNTKKNLNVLNRRGYLFVTFIISCFLFALFVFIFYFGDDPSIIDLFYPLVFAIIFANFITQMIARRKRKKPIEQEGASFKEEYKNVIDFIFHKRGVVAMNKKEIMIAVIAIIINSIPIVICAITEHELIQLAMILMQIGYFFVYYFLRKEIAKESCGFFELLMTLTSNLLTSYNEAASGISDFLIVANMLLLNYKMIKYVVVTIKRNRSKESAI